MTELVENLFITVFAALLAGVGWLITSQIQTNKSLTKAITNAVGEFKMAMVKIDMREKNQSEKCIMHGTDLKDRRLLVDGEIHAIKCDTTELKEHVIIIEKDIDLIQADIVILKGKKK